MTDPQFLTLTDAVRLHRSSIEKYGGDPGVRDIGLLESALAQPRAGFGGEFLYEDLPAMAAAYLFHIVSNHPFIDGNKRTGALAAYVFLQINDLQLNATQDDYTEIVLAVAQGKLSKEALTEFLRNHVQAL